MENLRTDRHYPRRVGVRYARISDSERTNQDLMAYPLGARAAGFDCLNAKWSCMTAFRPGLPDLAVATMEVEYH